MQRADVLAAFLSIGVLAGLAPGQCQPEEIQEIIASDGTYETNFALSVAVLGDTAIAGAIWNRDRGEEAGSAYIFRRGGDGVWTEVQQIAGADITAFDWFGYSVEMQGDLAFIGASRHEGGGAVYVFREDGAGVWVEVQKLVASDRAVNDGFGADLAVSGDTVMIGSPGDDDGGEDTGSVYFFRDDGTGVFHEVQKVIGSGVREFNRFGRVLDVYGDVALVGSSLESNYRGSAYIFRKVAGFWIQVDRVLASDGHASHFFGHAVSIDGGTAAIGAAEDTDNGDGAGAVYIFRDNGDDDWVQTQKLTPSDGAAGDAFGGYEHSVALIDERTVLVGALGTDGAGADTGAAYIFQDDGTGIWTEQTKFFPSNDLVRRVGMKIGTDGRTAIFGKLFDLDNTGDYSAAYLFDLGCACPADFNSDGVVDTRDFVAFLNAWAAGDAGADFDGNGVIDTRDFIAYLNLWAGGC